jgi:hypothetical protein
MNISVYTIRRSHLLGHEFLNRGLDLGNPPLGVQALSDDEMNRWIPTIMSSLDCLFGISNSLLDVQTMQVNFIRCRILVVLCWDQRVG